jgi:hypothetical protein
VPKTLALAIAAALTLSLLGCTEPARESPPANDPLAEALALRDAQLSELATSLGLTDPPTTELVQWVTPEEARDAWLGCLTNAGVAATPVGASEMAFDPADAEAVWICKAKYTLDPRVAHKLGSDKLSIIYRYFVDVQVPCLEEHGFVIEDAEPETRFKPHYYSDHPWIPYHSVPAEDVTAELIAACPVNAPFEDVYGEPLPLP